MLVDTVAWVRLEDGRILCARPRGKDIFYIPGGKREDGESDLQTLLREIDSNKLSIALRGATGEVRQKFMQNLSSRAAEMLSDDLAAMGPVKLSTVETAQNEIAKLAQDLAQQGRITIVGPSEKML